jgi:hypothetical protein
MKRRSVPGIILLSALVVLTAPAWAQTDIGSEVSPWGVRVGLASGPDQLVGGINFLETKVGENLFIVPNAEIGFGDDAIVLTGTAPIHYRFVVDGKVRPYAGGGVTVGWINKDKPNNNDSTDFEITLRGTGGIIWALKGGNEMFAELNLIFGDLYDAQVMVGWRF